MMPQSYAPLQAPRRLLFGPGPSMVAPRVYQAMAQPVVGHLDPFFFQVVEEIRTLLGYAFSTKNQFNIAVSGTGSAGMETAVANLLEPGEKFALLTNGFFGDRIGEMARRHGGEAVRLRGSSRVHPPRTPSRCRFRASRDVHRTLQPGAAHLRSGPRSGRDHHCRLRHVAGRHARAGGRNRYRHRLQLLPEGARLPSRPVAGHGVAARPGSPEGAPDAGAIVLSGPAASGQL